MLTDLRAFGLLKGGATRGEQHVADRWRSKHVLLNLTQARLRELEGWVLKVRQNGGLFYSQEPDRFFPITYYPLGFAGLNRAGGGSFDGSATITAISANSVTLATLPAGFIVARGDLMDIRRTVSGLLRRTMFMVTDNAAANGSGQITLSVYPSIPSHFTTASIADFNRPRFLAILDKDGYQPSDENGRRGINGYGGTILASEMPFI